MPGKPRGDHALTAAERQAARRARLKAAGVTQGWIRDPAAKGKPPVVVRYRRPADKRSRPQRWADAVETLADLIEDYQQWRDNLPASQADGEVADRLDEVLQLRDLVDQLAAAELPKGFGRD